MAYFDLPSNLFILYLLKLYLISFFFTIFVHKRRKVN